MPPTRPSMPSKPVTMLRALLNVLPLIRRMRMPVLLKELRNPVERMIPIVKDLASLVRPPSNVVGSRLGHCIGGSALSSLFLGTPALTMSIVCLVASPDVQLPLHGTIGTSLHQEIVLLGRYTAQRAFPSVVLLSRRGPGFAVEIVPVLEEVVAAFVQALYKCRDRIAVLGE